MQKRKNVCPECGSSDFDGTECYECSYNQLNCPFCNEIVSTFGEDARVDCCECVVAWYSYGDGEIIWKNDDFENYCNDIFHKRRRLSAADADDEDEDYDLEPIELDFLEELCEKEDWLVMDSHTDGGSHGHSHAAVFFFVDPDDRILFATR